MLHFRTQFDALKHHSFSCVCFSQFASMCLEVSRLVDKVIALVLRNSSIFRSFRPMSPRSLLVRPFQRLAARSANVCGARRGALQSHGEPSVLACGRNRSFELEAQSGAWVYQICEPPKFQFDGLAQVRSESGRGGLL